MANKTTTKANRAAISSWEDEGGAGPSDNRDNAVLEDERVAARNRLDSSHESNVRGEHRYADVHQTPAERTARQNRDDLKRRFGEGGPATEGNDPTPSGQE